ncbi:hypothetical protein M0802_014463 [Mischocyttarus mexicanus]|nr:hypothetical protein M0802_014463 [Mischocyttarus mexicanus]
MERKRLPTKVKKEEADEEIREYAATAMSELLGWYGYEKVDSGYTRGLNLDHFATSKHPLPQMDRQFLFDGSSRSAMATNHHHHQSAFSHSLRTKLTPSYYSNDIFKNNDKVSASPSLQIKTVLPSTSRLPYNNDSTSSSPGKITIKS